MSKPLRIQRIEKVREIEDAAVKRIGQRALRKQLVDLTIRQLRVELKARKQ